MKFDVSIVGAGPAGLATAICCAEAGLKVCVLERSIFPRACVGESVHPGAEALFHRLRIAEDVASAGFLRYSGIWVSRDGKKDFQAFGGSAQEPWEGFHLWRPEFDQILLKRARAAGAVCIEECNLSQAEVINRKVKIHSSAGPIESSVVVDGSGRSRWLARQWQFKLETYSRTLIAHYGYQERGWRTYPEGPLFVPRRDGWDWTARVRTDLYQWISLRSGRHKIVNEFPSCEFQQSREVGPQRGADVTWRLVAEPAGRHHFLVGDACAVLDPSSSHGMIRALSSGILAATCISEVLRQGFRNYGRVVQGYCTWQRKWFQKDSSVLRNLSEWAKVANSWSKASMPSWRA
jgi:flavin-dependent dehydrogenase